MPIYHSTDDTDEPRVVMLSSDGLKVRFERMAGSDQWLYRSMAREDSEWINAPTTWPLPALWHHAMVFFGVVPPDDHSHPPA